MKVEEYLKKNKKLSKNYFYNLLKRTMLTISLVLVVMIISKNSENFRNMVNKYTFNSNYNFSKINQLYKKYLLSLKKTKELISPVNGSSILEYTKSEKYNDGVILEVGENYNVKMIESGLVVYVGEKEGIGNTIIVQQSNGIDVKYGFLDKIDVKVYDYIEKGTIIGNSNNKLYLEFSKDGKVVSYEPYIK